MSGAYASTPPTWKTVITTSAPSSASRSVAATSTRAGQLAQFDQLASGHRGSLGGRNIDVEQHDRRRPQRGERQDVSDELHREHPSTRADDHDPRAVGRHRPIASRVRRSNRWIRSGTTPEPHPLARCGLVGRLEDRRDRPLAPLPPRAGSPLPPRHHSRRPSPPWCRGRRPRSPSGSTTSTTNSSEGPPSLAGRKSSGRRPTATSGASGPDHGSSSVAEPDAPVRAVSAEQVHRRAADEARDEEVRRAAVDVLRLPDLLDSAVRHHDDPVTERHRLDLVVGDVDRRDAQALVDPLQLRAHLDAELRVEVRQRLVQEEGLRLAHQRPAHRDALALAAGELRRTASQEVVQSEDRARLPDAAFDLGLRRLPLLQPEREVLVHGHVRVERVVLEDHRDVAIAWRHVVHDPVPDRDRARTWASPVRRRAAARSSCRSRRGRRGSGTRRRRPRA